jgi:hypothetical protein
MYVTNAFGFQLLTTFNIPTFFNFLTHLMMISITWNCFLYTFQSTVSFTGRKLRGKKLLSSLYLSLPTNLLSFFYPSKYRTYSSLHAYYMPCPSHPPWFDHPNYIWRGVQVMKLLIMYFSLAPYYFVPLRSKYCLQIPVFKQPQSILFP